MVADEEQDQVTPMQQIQKKRSKWRTKQAEDLEDTWGSLNLFNKSHRGRLSLDMAGERSLSYFPVVLLCFRSPAWYGSGDLLKRKNLLILHSLSFFASMYSRPVYVSVELSCSFIDSRTFIIYRQWNIHHL